MSPQSYTFVYATIILFVSGAYTLDPNSGEYGHCDWCRPGEYMKRPCTGQTPTLCLPCPMEHYTERYNYWSECHRCHQCNLTEHGHEHETLPCVAVQNRQCECDMGYFKKNGSAICLQHTKCPIGQGVKEIGTPWTNTRCMRCKSGTFSDEISSTAECRAHTDCAARRECFVFRGHHKRDNVCVPCSDHATNTSSTFNDKTKLQHSDSVTPKVYHIALGLLFLVAIMVVLIVLRSVPPKIKKGFKNDHIGKEEFQLYNTRLMENLQRETEAARIAIDLSQRVVEENLHLKNQAGSDKRVIARLKEENAHLKNQAGSDKRKVARLKDQIASLTTETNNTYGMSRKPRGIAVIINNIHFEGMATRDGAEGDTGRLREALESLGFTVMTFIDLDHSKMVATIEDQGKADHSNYDCFVCCIMSHGTTGKVFPSNGIGIDICELMKLFNAKKCPSLKGKPKLFFIQACQGKKIQGKESIEGDLDVTPIGDVPLNFICHDADFFLGLATVPGYVTKRGKDGAPYVHHLAEMLKVYGPTHNLSAIMAMVCDKMNDINDDKCGWISSNHSTLRKKVFFNTK